MDEGNGPARRLVVAAGLTLLVGGCGIRLEDDAPHVPLVPTRTPIPGETDLIAVLHGTRALAARLTAVSVERAEELAGWHEEQAVVLDAALRRAAVPADLLDPAPASRGTAASSSGVSSESSPSSGPASSSASAEGTAALVRDEQSAMASVQGLLGVATPELLPMLASLRASRHVVCRVLDPAIPFPGIFSPAPSPPGEPAAPDPGAVLPFLAATREAAYGMEVVAARASGKRREQAIRRLDELRALALAQEQAAGASAPPAPSAYELPLSADEQESADRLAQYLLGALPGAYARALAALVPADGQPDRPSLIAGADWLARAAVLADDSGAAPGSFPGLQ